jgi:hypothetical protein
MSQRRLATGSPQQSGAQFRRRFLDPQRAHSDRQIRQVGIGFAPFVP